MTDSMQSLDDVGYLILLTIRNRGIRVETRLTINLRAI